MRSFAVCVMCVVTLAMAAAAGAVEIVLSSSVFDGGGGLAPGKDTCANGSIGQSMAGFVGSPRMLHWSGFWAGETTTPTSAASLSSLRQMASGSYISLSGTLAASSAGDLSPFFYVEAADRSAGMRVNPLQGQVAGLERGSTVNVIGTLNTLASGERQISAPVVILAGKLTEPAALGMPSYSVGGGDFGIPPGTGQYGVTGGTGLNNVGLLVSTWGVVKFSSNGYFAMTDGSLGDNQLAVLVYVATDRLSSTPATGRFVCVTGLSSLLLDRSSQRQRYILPRDDKDVTVY